MEDAQKNKFMVILFLGFILLLIVGGFILSSKVKNGNLKSKNKEDKTQVVMIDEDKDYVFFENEETINDEPDVTYKDPIINFESAKIINETLKSENQNYKNSVVYLKDKKLDSDKELVYPESVIYSANVRDYKVYKTSNYVTLMVYDSIFDCYKELAINSLKSYIFDAKTGVNLLEDDILSKYNINRDNVKERVLNYLKENQTTNEDVEVIKIDDTIDSLFDLGNFAYFVEGSDIYISIIVKSNFIDYNEDIKIN